MRICKALLSTLLLAIPAHTFIPRTSSSAPALEKNKARSNKESWRIVQYTHTDAPTTSTRLSAEVSSSSTPLLSEDEASTTPQLLSSLWDLICKGVRAGKGEQITKVYSKIDLTDKYVELVLGHLHTCEDVCYNLGINCAVVPFRVNDQVRGFTVKSYGEGDFGGAESDGEYDFGPDPFWDDVEVTDWGAMLAEEDDDEPMNEDILPPVNPDVPDDDEFIIDTTKVWVSKMMSDMGVCPFTSGAEMAGLPMGKVYYTVDRNSLVEDLYASYWKEVVRVEQANEKDLSTTLQIAPCFALQNVEMWENFCNTLTHPLEPLKIEDLIQLVFFHPNWTFRDGNERSGPAAAANYARRSPWPMINILRTKQVRAAQKGIPTGLVYQQNEKTLNSVGSNELQQMLFGRNWDPLKDFKVDRRDIEALRVAQDFQAMQKVDEKDTSFTYDSTPAVSKVNKEAQKDGGDIVKVILDAIETREKNGKLTGAETSVTLMAMDMLLDELSTLQQQ